MSAREAPCAMVIFGASGDLARRKLIPALYNLAAQGLLSENFAVVGFSRPEMSQEDFRTAMGQEVRRYVAKVDHKAWARLERGLYYVRGDFGDPAAFRALKERLGEVESAHGTRGNAIFYLATAPDFFAPVVEAAAAVGLTTEEKSAWRRVIVEKPFGNDLESARALDARLRRVLKENQIYRIDHYLGKETVQNLIVFRFANGIFEPIWNRRYVDHVQISVCEDAGVGRRGGYYERAGALRDMVPNHLFQILGLMAMEPPVSFDADAVRGEQVKVLRALQPMSPENVLGQSVRGQYGEGMVAGVKVPAYRAEPLVAPDSRAETFVALKLYIDSWRWAGVPFYLRTGKRLACRASEIVIQFKSVPFVLFQRALKERLKPNQLVIRIQPNEGIALSFEAKIPGPMLTPGTVNMDFRYGDYFGENPSTGYERLLHDCMLGDATLFRRSDMVEVVWSAVTPILDVWKALPPRDFPNYAAGVMGPAAADELLLKDGRQWRACGA